MDYTQITGAVDWSDVLIAIGATAAALAVVYVGRRGAGIVLGFLSRGR